MRSWLTKLPTSTRIHSYISELSRGRESEIELILTNSGKVKQCRSSVNNEPVLCDAGLIPLVFRDMRQREDDITKTAIRAILPLGP